MKILSLDLATKTGFAVGQHTDNPRFGLMKMPSAPGFVGRFVSDFDEQLGTLLDFEQPEWIVFEAPIVPGGGARNVDTSRKLMALAGHLEFTCHRRALPLREANISTVKKFWAGHGRAEKPAMVAAARRYGFMTSDHNEADALAVWAYQVHHKFPDQKHRWAAGQLGAAA